MTDDTDHTQTDQPGSELPKFAVNVVPAKALNADRLGALLERYRRGENEPLVFGDDNNPEAAIIPFPALVRLFRHDHRAVVRDEAELARRVQEADASDDPGMTIDELGEELGEPASSMIRRVQGDDA